MTAQGLFRIADREPGTWDIYGWLVGGVIGCAYAGFRFWLLGRRMPLLFALGVVAVVAWSIWRQYFRVKWIELTPAGISFRDGRRRGAYSWAEVESFQVGNPADPVHAYVTLSSGKAVVLPKFHSAPAVEVVHKLSAQQTKARLATE